MAIQFLNTVQVDTSVLYVDTANDKVGIGTDSPSYKLDVNGNVQLQATLYVRTRIQGLNSVGSYSNLILNDLGANVGIGTASPFSTAKLQVKTATDKNLAIQTGTTNTTGIKINAFNDAGSANIPLELNGSILSLKTGETERMRITSGGNVGIGETSVDARLHITALASNGISNVKLESPGASKWAFGIPAGQTYFALDDVNDNLTTPKLVVLKTSGNVGIGTDSPDVKFQVQGGVVKATTSDYVSPSTGGAISMFQDSNDYGTIWAVSDYNGSWADVAIAPLGGNVGIGTTSPSAFDALADNFVINAATSAGMTISESTGAGTSNILFAATSSFANRGNITYDHTATAMTFGINASEKMRINSSGNVGIGVTSNTTHKLIVSGGSNIASFRSEGSGQNLKKLSISTGGDRVVLDASTTTDTTAAFAFQTGGVERMRILDLGGIKFNAYDSTNNTGTPTYLLGTDASGNIVKTNTIPGSGAGPYLPLTAGSSYPLTGSLYINSNKTLVLNNLDNTNGFQIYNSGATGSANADLIFTSGTVGERMRINSSGNVGIGTTSPDSPLEIEFAEDTGTTKEMLHLDYNPVDNYGSALFKISSGGSANNIFEIEQVTGGGAGDFGTYVDTNIINRNVSSGAYGNINFVTGSSTSASSIVMTIGGGTQKGNVGIGTTSPDAKLEVAGGTTGILLSNLGDSSAYDAIRMTYSGYNSGIPEFIFEPKTAPGSGTVNSYFRFQTRPNGGAAGTGNVANVTVDGKVGIGTQTPGSKLSIDSVPQDALSINSSDGDGPYAVWRRQNGTLGFVGNANALSLSGNTNFGVRATNDLVFAAGGASEKMRIDSTGNVMIGNTNASAKLDIRQDTGYALRTENASGSTFRVEADTGNIEAAGSVKMGDDSDAASATKVGTMRYRTGTEYVEVTGTELIPQPLNFTNGWNSIGSTTTITANTFVTVTSAGGIRKPTFLTVGQVYRMSISGTTTTTSNQINNYSNNSSYKTWSGTGAFDFTFTFTATTDGGIYLRLWPGTAEIYSLSVMEVTEENASYADMCMQTGASTYEWVNIVRNTY